MRRDKVLTTPRFMSLREMPIKAGFEPPDPKCGDIYRKSWSAEEHGRGDLRGKHT